LDGPQHAGRRVYWKSSYLADLRADAIDTILGCAATLPAPDAIINIERYGGAASRVLPEATAFPHRDGDYLAGIMSVWDDPTADDANVDWVRTNWARMAPSLCNHAPPFAGETVSGDGRRNSSVT